MHIASVLVVGSVIVALIITIVILTQGKRKDRFKLVTTSQGTGDVQFALQLELRGGDSRFYVNTVGGRHYAFLDDPRFEKGQKVVGRCLSDEDKLVYKKTLLQHANDTQFQSKEQLLRLQAEDARADAMLRELETVKKQIADKIGTLRVVSGGAYQYLIGKFGEFGDPICVRPDGRVYSAGVVPGGLTEPTKELDKVLGRHGAVKTASLDLT